MISESYVVQDNWTFEMPDTGCSMPAEGSTFATLMAAWAAGRSLLI